MKNLTYLPSVPVWLEENTIIFDRKFYDGMLAYLSEWPGTITCVMSSSDEKPPDFGIVKKIEKDLPFKIRILHEKKKITLKHIKSASILLASGDEFNQFHLAKLCKKNNIKCVYTIENIPETRYQMVSINTPNTIIKLRRYFFIWNGELKRIKAFKYSDGIQANGMPAYNQYKNLNQCMKYYDTRVSKNLIITEGELNQRLDSFLNNNIITLAFSGRLIAIKGADHLIELASILKKKGLLFRFFIYGAGDLEDQMNKKIMTYQLEYEVKMMGSVDFNDKLIPDLKKNVDLFVMLHRQSDPSCTYLETMSCGVPIVGYENKAFKGILSEADIGWGKALDDLDGVADIIIKLDKDREQIKEKSINAMLFARNHDFETTFTNRINHLRKVCGT